jgi:hypothetical protein
MTDSARVIVPHATSREDKAYGWNDCGGGREGNSGNFYAEWVIAEREDCNLRSWTLEDRKTQVSGRRGLSSGVASGKSSRSRYAYGWVETSTPLSSRFHC